MNSTADTRQQVRLPRSLVNRLLALAQQSPEEEICGLISRTEPAMEHSRDMQQTARLYPIDNVAADTRRRYRLDPAQQIAALRTMRERGEALYAIYHSHPHSPPRPSATDITEASYPEAVYLIISLDVKGVIEMRAFRLLPPDAVRELPLAIMD